MADLPAYNLNPGSAVAPAARAVGIVSPRRWNTDMTIRRCYRKQRKTQGPAQGFLSICDNAANGGETAKTNIAYPQSR